MVIFAFGFDALARGMEVVICSGLENNATHEHDL